MPTCCFPLFFCLAFLLTAEAQLLRPGLVAGELIYRAYFLFVCFLSWRHFDTFVLFITQYNAPAAWMFKGDICSAALPAQLLFFNKICSNWPWKGFEAICSALLHHESSVVKRTCCLLGVTAKPAYNSSIIQRSIRTHVVPWECVQSLFTWPGSV